MLTFLGRGQKFCDGISRRAFLRVGALGLGGLTLADVLRAQTGPQATKRPKSAILVFLSGGPSHLDTWDMKPDLSDDFRGEFKPIHSNVPGMDLCELMPLQAKIADKFAILRGVKTVGFHSGNEFYSGYAFEQGDAGKPLGTLRPAFGSLVSRVRPTDSPMPAYVSLQDAERHEQVVYAGAAHQPFRLHRYSRKEPLDNLRRAKDVTLERLQDRRELLHSFDSLRRDLDSRGAFDGQDALNARALDIVTSGKVRDAFDLSLEPEKLRARYGSKPCMFGYAPGDMFLQARRLIEAGVSVVTIAVHGWDTHEKNFELLRNQLPILDQAYHALLTDLEDRGLFEDVVVLMGGEMGRTPKITKGRAGREHWPDTGVNLIAGGGLKMGQVIGASDARGEQPKTAPIRPQHMMATLYHVLGIDPATTIPDLAGRPQYLLDDREPIAALL
jgi:hypothetical protein